MATAARVPSRHRGDARSGLEQLLVLAEAAPEAFEVLDDSDGEVGDFVMELAEEFGDFDAALRAYRLACGDAPTLTNYAGGRRLSGAAWAGERPPLLAAARREGAIGILLDERPWDDAIAAVEASGPYGYVSVEQVAVAVGAERPDWAIAACQQQIDAGTAAERRIIPRARRAARMARDCCRSHPAASAENPPAG